MSAKCPTCNGTGVVPESTLQCPYCDRRGNITRIYRPEVYEYSYFCNNCSKGFN